jgi:hypothetical protein
VTVAEEAQHLQVALGPEQASYDVPGDLAVLTGPRLLVHPL